MLEMDYSNSTRFIADNTSSAAKVLAKDAEKLNDSIKRVAATGNNPIIKDISVMADEIADHTKKLASMTSITANSVEKLSKQCGNAGLPIVRNEAARRSRRVRRAGRKSRKSGGRRK
jgi:methyl-accepting chemotaxis protein